MLFRSLPVEKRVAVYPKLVGVSVDKVLQDMWDTHSTLYGYLEDVTLLRSVRGYLPSDPAKRINQRLLARGQGLMINQYEIVTPTDVLFILDTASFAGQDPEHLETTLSVLASLLVGLCRRKIQVGLAVPASTYFPEMFVPPSSNEADLFHMLELLVVAEANGLPLRGPLPVDSPGLIGQTYYIAHRLDGTTSLKLLAPFPEHKTKLLLWYPEESAGKTGRKVSSVQSFRRMS